jgi:hypothetical protein
LRWRGNHCSAQISSENTVDILLDEVTNDSYLELKDMFTILNLTLSTGKFKVYKGKERYKRRIIEADHFGAFQGSKQT